MGGGTSDLRYSSKLEIPSPLALVPSVISLGEKVILALSVLVLVVAVGFLPLPLGSSWEFPPSLGSPLASTDGGSPPWCARRAAVPVVPMGLFSPPGDSADALPRASFIGAAYARPLAPPGSLWGAVGSSTPS